MKNEFVPYELALRMKQLGFDGPCFGYYDGTRNLNYMFEGKPENFSYRKFTLGHFVGWTSAPTFSQAFRWFREKYGYWSYVKESMSGMCRFYIEKFDEKFFNSDIIYSYEQAEISCLEKLIEIVESKKEIR